MDAALLPINQRIVGGEPAVSQDGGDRLIERSDVEVDGENFPGGKVERNQGGPSDSLVGCAVEKLQVERSNRRGNKMVFLREVRIYKTVRRSGIDKSAKG